MHIYIIWKKSISGWSKEIDCIFIKEKKAQEFVKKISGGTQYYFEIEKFKVC